MLIAWQRPRLPLGWLLLAAAVCQTLSASAAVLDVLGARRGWPQQVLWTLETLFAHAWPRSIALFFSFALLVFPNGLLLADAVQCSREQIVSAREEERRRLGATCTTVCVRC